ncbi:MAG: peptide deformylase [Erysipelotrichaceae bacterium]|jgi:peptide deformylase|nr:peptide deformylase [Erysipelotrichaceae bacterium]
MIRPLEKDPLRLARKAVPVSQDDLADVKDLIDTLRSHQNECVGMALNMIGIAKAAIAIDEGNMVLVMLNPKILKRKDPYQAKEGCLCLRGVKETVRYQEIMISYQDLCLQKHTKVFRDYTAEIIQHECDHLAGILI